MKMIQTIVLGVLLAMPVLAQGTQPAPRDKGQKAAGHGAMTASCEDMMKQHQQMMSDMQQMNKQLQAKVSAMNSATGEQKVQAIADTVNELAKQHQGMFDRMQQMHSGTMTHMSEHMQSGGAQSMANCPMMKEMGQSGMQAQRGKDAKPAPKSRAE
ncbi:MAG: hypothetical protein EHM23_26440 [Acidobacteria bacterium]|nr:MAG: hypothetical protein EHM23_26440 [Acidobacteriota bacterium]